MPPSSSRSAAPTFTGCVPASSANAPTSPPSSQAATIGPTGRPKPPNFQLVADELQTRLGFKRHRESVAAFARTHFPELICQPKPRPKARRRWKRSRIDELWQHDSSIHQWWPAYTDGLSLFGHDFMADDRDPCSEFQRAFYALGVTHLVAPSPQAKGKIERRFGTLQKRLVAILAYEKASSYAAAQSVLDREVQRQNATVCRTTSLSPNAAWEKALAEKRAVTRLCPPATLLDLHLALHLKRRVNAHNQIDFLGQSWHIAPTKRASITLIHHPLRQFWAVTQPPSPPLNICPEFLGKYSL